MSVAIRAITRLQDADDAPILGVGQDGYVLQWDNGTGAFVAVEPSAGVVDHGALTGLSDDDHTGYALLAGRSGGQTLYGGTSANDDITIHGTSNATRTTSYVILQPTAGNVGIGMSAPGARLEVATEATGTIGQVIKAYAGQTANLQEWRDSSSSPLAKLRAEGGLWINAAGGLALDITGGVGGNVVFQATTAYSSFAGNYFSVGASANFVLGAKPATAIATSNSAPTIQLSSSRWTGTATENENFSIGNTRYDSNDGRHALTITDGDSVVAMAIAGKGGQVCVGYAFPAVATLSLGQFHVRSALATTVTLTARGAASQSANLQEWQGSSGNVLALVAANGAATFKPLDAATSTVTNVVTIGHDTTGTAAAGFGGGLAFNLQSSTTAAQNAARIKALWYEATHATFKGDLVGTAYDAGGEREGWRVRGAGSEPALGFYGVAPIARALLATGAGASVDDVITALQNLGLVKQS